MRRSIAALAAIMSLAASEAAAAVIVDTGAQIPFTAGLQVSSGQWVAARFDVTGPTRITDVEGYLANVAEGATLTFALREDDGGPGDELFAGAATLFLPEAWQGLHGLSWSVGPGAYWLAFEVRAGQTLDGAVGVPLTPSMRPIAVGVPPAVPYRVGEDGLVAFRVNGDAVPEPASWALMIMGFGAVGAVLRRRRNDILTEIEEARHA
jgi:hypothetical protein